MPSTVSLTIDSIAAGGDGVGRTGGLVVFVPRTAPGDIVTATVTGKGHFARGALRAVVQPSPTRVDPLCPHYTCDRCGGCQLQHMTYESQLAAKQRMIADAMFRIGKRQVELSMVHPSPDAWRYRTKLTLALRRKLAGWIAGLHRYDDPAQVFPVMDCLITDSRVVAVWREVMAASQHFPDELALRASVQWTAEGAVFTLLGGRRWSDHERFFEQVPTLAALYWEPLERPRVLLADRRKVRAPGASFSQANPGVATLLRRHVVERVMSYAPDTVVDAYAGSGDLGVELAEHGVRVTTIELDGDAVEWSRARLPEGGTAVRGRVEEVLGDWLPTDVLVLNPPRTGVHQDVPALLERDPKPRAVVYISCDPATLARDVARLPGYRVASLVAFDMFPQTSHVETVCELVPEAA